MLSMEAVQCVDLRLAIDNTAHVYDHDNVQRSNRAEVRFKLKYCLPAPRHECIIKITVDSVPGNWQTVLAV